MGKKVGHGVNVVGVYVGYWVLDIDEGDSDGDDVGFRAGESDGGVVGLRAGDLVGLGVVVSMVTAMDMMVSILVVAMDILNSSIIGMDILISKMAEAEFAQSK